LLIIAHGSRREAANTEFREIVDKVREQVSGLYTHVEPAFLDCAEPTLDEAAAALIRDGVRQIDVYPFFLTTGKHADQDIPRLAAAVNARNPNCTVAMLDYLGRSEELPAVIIRHIHAQNGARR